MSTRQKFLRLFIFTLLIGGVVFTGLTSCSDDEKSSDKESSVQVTENEDAENDSSSVTGLTKLKVKDSAGTFLGYSIKSNDYSLELITEKGYMYTLMWDGEIRDDDFSYGASGCSGTVYNNDEPGAPLYGKHILKYKNGAVEILYKPANIDANNVVQWVNVTVQSSFSGGTCSDGSSTADYIELTEITRSDAGIPETITPPIVYDFGE